MIVITGCGSIFASDYSYELTNGALRISRASQEIRGGLPALQSINKAVLHRQSDFVSDNSFFFNVGLHELRGESLFCRQAH